MYGVSLVAAAAFVRVGSHLWAPVAAARGVEFAPGSSGMFVASASLLESHRFAFANLGLSFRLGIICFLIGMFVFTQVNARCNPPRHEKEPTSIDFDAP